MNDVPFAARGVACFYRSAVSARFAGATSSLSVPGPKTQGRSPCCLLHVVYCLLPIYCLLQSQLMPPPVLLPDLH
jgi:hypothetical protein